MRASSLLVALAAAVAWPAPAAASPLVIPQADPATLDGSCGDYADGTTESFQDAGGATGRILTKHDGEWLWICVEAAAGTGADRGVEVFLDRLGDGGEFPQPDDARLLLQQDQARSGFRGAEPPELWTPWPGLAPHWDGAAASGRTGEAYEFRLSIQGLQLGTCGGDLSIGIVHADVNGPGDDHSWPAGATSSDPAGWRAAGAAGAPCACGGSFPALADAEMRQDDPDAALGGATEMYVAREGGGERISLMAFDLSPSIPAGATVERATLELPLAAAAGEVPYRLEAHRLDERWSEAAVTWNGRPAIGQVWSGKDSSLDAGLLEVDVTGLARGWATGSIAEQSLALATSTEGAVLVLWSRETAPDPGGPVLRVVCSMPATDVVPDAEAGDGPQMLGLGRLVDESTAPVALRLDEEGGGVRSARFSLPVPASMSPDGGTRARWFLESYGDLLRVADVAGGWQLVRRSDDDRHIFFRQRHAGIPVFPSGLVVHLEPGVVAGVAGRYVPAIGLSPEPRIDAPSATTAARLATGRDPVGLTSLTWFNPGLLGDADRATHLAWAVPFPDRLVLVDAHSGALLDSIARVEDAGFLILDANNTGPYGDWTCWFPWFIADADPWLNQGGALSSEVDTEGWTAWDAMKDVDAYWSQVHKRNSYDGAGSPTWLFIHVGTAGSWGSLGFPQAISSPFCDQLEFSDGTPTLDVVGHEYAHNVTRHTAALVYKNQSGALNESMSDVFGQFVDNDDWTIGEGSTFGILRDFESPTFRGGLAVDMSNYWSTSSDKGGVHTNSAIPNKVAYLVSEGGVHQGYPVAGIGQEKTQRLWWHVLANKLWLAPDFADARDAFVDTARAFAAKKQYAFTSQNACSVQNAWRAVGLGAGDLDCDGIPDVSDLDIDGDGIADPFDNCILMANPSQTDTDGDGVGNACDDDDDGDGVDDATDNCPLVSNADQVNWYGGPAGNVCDDTDGDQVVDATDNCPLEPNKDQKDTDGTHGGDACDWDDDGDLVADDVDNCPLIYNKAQTDGDGDGVGDPCDLCPGLSSPDNGDPDQDGLGNPCDDDDDGDGVLDALDNCPLTANSGQVDLDQDGIGLACDENEQDWFAQAAIGGLVVPVDFGGDVGPIVLPLPIGPADGPLELPAGFKVQVSLSLPFAYAAQVIGSDGLSWAKAGPAIGPMSFSFTPAVHGATSYSVSASGQAVAGEEGSAVGVESAAPSLLVPAPDQMRYSLRILPVEPVDPSATHDLYLRLEPGQPPDHLSHVVADSCPSHPPDPGRGILAPGEEATLAVTLALESAASGPDVSAILTATTQGVTVTRPVASFEALISPGAARSLAPHFAVTVDQSVPCGTPLEFDLEVQAGVARVMRHLSVMAGGEIHAETTFPPNPIVDLGTAAMAMEVAAPGIVASVEPTVWIRHPETSQLELWLIAPDGTRVALALQRGAGADFAGTTFSDDAGRTLDDGASPFPARFVGDAPLDVLAGLSTAGEWRLEVMDTVRGGPEGELSGWSLRLELAEPVCDACAPPQPGEVPWLWWEGEGTLRWSAVGDAAWYNVHEGKADHLDHLLTRDPDSCRRAQGLETGAAITVTPGPGELRWYLVRAASGAGEGTAGPATAGERMQESFGDCP